MPFDIRRIDLDSEADLTAVAALHLETDEYTYGAAARRTPAQQRAFLVSTPYWDVVHFGAFDQETGTLAGVGGAFLALTENTDNLDIGLTVHPDWRRRGVGSALADELARIGRDAGRPKTTWWHFIPLDGDPDSLDHPTNRIARRLGLERRNIAILRRLDLPVAPELLAELAAEAAPYVEAAGCRIVTWRGPIPEEYFDQYGLLLTQLDLDDPDEDMELEAHQYDDERLRTLNQRNRERGTESIIAVAIAPDGTMAGNSELQYSVTAGTTLVCQENTLVMPDWRGHRLGIAMKAATHALLGDAMPDAKYCVTWNSHINEQMIAINDRLGYRPHLRELGFQTAP